MPTARTRASTKYNAKAYDRFHITVPKGQRDEIEGAAREAGMSRNAFVVSAIMDKMGRGAEAPQGGQRP